MHTPRSATNPPDGLLTHSVIEALYDLPLDGSWHDVQTALCAFWAGAGQHPRPDDLRLLERHFSRALSFMERVPVGEQGWREELYRVPVAAAVFDRTGDLLDANELGKWCVEEEHGGVGWHAANLNALRAGIAALGDRPVSNSAVTARDGTALHLYLSRIPPALAGESALYLAVIVTRNLPATSADLLASQFELTERELELCLQLAAGASLDDVARSSKVKKTTLRTHLANSFCKLDVKSQPELVSRVLHHVFASRQLAAHAHTPPRLTPYLDPEIHGHPAFNKLKLPDGRELGYLEYGDRDGIPAFYLHGSLDAGLFMKDQKLSGNGVRLLAVERPGVGESTPTTDPSPASYARDIVRLADHLNIDRYAVIGRSMGSWDAIAVTLEDPERAVLLVLASGRIPVERLEQHERHDPFYRALFNGIWHSDLVGRLMLRTLLLQLHIRGPQHFFAEADRAPVDRTLIRDPLFLRHMKAVWLRAAAHGPEPIHAHLKLYRDPVPTPPWKNLAVRTVLVHGEADTQVPVERLRDQTASFQHREIIMFPDVGHMLVHSSMGEVLRIVARQWR